jgi:hypothetical protein
MSNCCDVIADAFALEQSLSLTASEIIHQLKAGFRQSRNDFEVSGNLATRRPMKSDVQRNSSIGLLPHPTDSKHYVVLVRIGERPVISKFDAETLAIVLMFAEPGQSQREAVVKGMARFKETAITDHGQWQILGRGSHKRDTAIQTDVSRKIATVRLGRHNPHFDKDR